MSTNLAPVDPNVRVPAAVLAAAKRADELQQQIIAGQNEQNEQLDAQPAAQDDPAAPAEPEAAAEAPQAAQEGQPDPQRYLKEPAAESKDGKEPDWKNRYDSMKGRYDADMARMRQQLQALADDNSALRAELDRLRDEATQAPAQSVRFVTPQEEEDFGTDFMRVVGKRAKEEVLPEIAELKQQVSSLKKQLGSVGNVVQESARNRMISTLDREVQNWREINRDQRFIDWLSLPDPYSGAIRHEMLKAAFAQNNPVRVAAFFNGFLAEEAAVSPAETEVQPQAQPAKPSLEKYAAPGRAKTAAAPSAPPEKPSFTRAQVSRFYADVANGRYRGREAEKQRIEQQIFEASQQGRIR